MVKVRPKRGGSGWEIDIRFRWPDGSSFRERKNAPVTGKDAAKRWGEARERDLLAKGKIVVEAPPPSAVPTLEDFWPRVLREHYRAERKKPSTIDAAESIERNHLRPLLGKVRLDAISSALVAKLKGRLSEHEPKTVNNVLSVLSKTLHCAVRWEVLAAMPCRIELLKTSAAAMAWYEVEDYRRLVDAAGDRATRLLILLGGSAGLRRGEIRALRWSDVDLIRGQLRIENALWRQEEGTTKGGRYRIVPMTPELAAALKAHRHLRERVLYSHREEELSNRTVRNWLAAAQRRAGLKDNGGAHILRHTFCSHLAAAGVPAKAIQELAGHADLSTTLKYMHLSPGDRAGAIATLGRYYGVGTATAVRLTGMKTTRKTVDVAALSTFEQIDAAWSANIGADGRIVNLALSRRLADRERDVAIQALGFAPEDRSSYGTRYAATGGELRKWAEEKLSKGAA